MGNKVHQASSDSPVKEKQADGRQGQPTPSIFNCMALSQSSCCNYEISNELEIDQQRISRNGGKITGQSSVHSLTSIGIHKPEMMRIPQFQLVDERTQMASVTNVSETNVDASSSQKKMAMRFSSVQQSTSIIANVGPKNYAASRNEQIRQLEARSLECFNNRNAGRMNGGFESNNTSRQLSPNYREQNFQLNIAPSKTAGRLFHTTRGNEGIVPEQASPRKQYFDTPSDNARVGGFREKSPNKIALTEIDPSEGDCSPPEINYEDNLSPSICEDVPEDLRDLDQNEDIDDTLDIRSMQSHRLYTLSPDQEEIVKKKTVAKNKRVVKSKTLYPDLTKLKRPIKEQSRQLAEFTKSSCQYQAQKNKNFYSQRLAPQRQILIMEGLSDQIRQFIVQTQKRFASVTLQSGSIFVGELSPQGAQGLGFCQEPDRSYFYGNWKDGKKHGRGTYVRYQGASYQGTWVNDEMHGTGMMKQANGTIYKGKWHNNQPHGTGQEIFADKSCYTGHFFRGQKSGMGELVFPDGGIYKGQFDKNQINGHGVYNWPTGIYYEGIWKFNKKNGKGVLKWRDGSREYRGEFKDDERHGQGTYVWEHGTKSYRGLWRNGLKDGMGYVRDEFDFIERKGLWFCDKLVKWMPKDDEDEGQDGESIVSQDIADWEGQNSQQPSSDFLAHGVQHDGKLSANLRRSTHNRRSSVQFLVERIVEENKEQTDLQAKSPIMTEPAQSPTRLIILNQKNQHKSRGELSSNSRRPVPAFRKATEEVKRLNVKRKKISKRISTKEQSADHQQSSSQQQVVQDTRGMLSLDRRVKLVSGCDLNQFNPPEVWSELEKQKGVELPSPHFKSLVVNVDESVASEYGLEAQNPTNEAEEINEYFMFSADVDNPEQSF